MNFRAFLVSLGLNPKTVAADGKWRRCSTQDKPRSKNGAYKLAIDGRVGFAQDWATMQEPAVWRPDEDAKLPEFDPAALRRARAEQRRKLVDATTAARAFYQRCDPLRGGHPYLEDHGLGMRGCLGLKVDKDGWLVVPALQGRSLMSVQRISPTGDKRFWPGASVSGTSYPVERRSATVTVLCEGLATGLACYAALPMCRVLVAWNAGNLAKTPERPTGMVVIAADNDHATEERTGKNPGIEAAQDAADLLGCGVAYPTGIKGTDWADYRTERLAARLEREGPHETRGTIGRTVDAEIAGALMREAVFVARQRETA